MSLLNKCSQWAARGGSKQGIAQATIIVGTFWATQAIALCLGGEPCSDFFTALYAVILIHELGHTLVAWCNRINAWIIMIPFLGGLCLVRGFFDRRQQIVFFAAGPLPGILLGLCLLLSQNEIEMAGLSDRLWAFLFLFVNLINLLPLTPLDGGRLAALLLEKYPKIRCALELAALLAVFYGLWLEPYTAASILILWFFANEHHSRALAIFASLCMQSQCQGTSKFRPDYSRVIIVACY